MGQTFAEVLVSRGVIDDARMREAQSATDARGGSLSRTLLELGLCSERDLVSAMATQLGLAYADCTPGAVDPEAARLLPRAVAEELTALPVAFTPSGGVVVATTSPDRKVWDRVGAATGMSVQGALAVRDDLLAAIKALAGDGSSPAGQPAAGLVTAAAPRPVLPPAQHAGGDGNGLLAYEQDAPVDLHAVLREMLRLNASDLHLTSGLPPTVRVHGELRPLEGYPTLRGEDMPKLLYSMLSQKQRQEFENHLELDLSYSLPKEARFRVNIFRQRDALGAVLRVIPFEIKSLEDLGVPPQIKDFARLSRGFVLVTGPTGSGKSTTLASLIDVINRERACHIMTVEDPIEFLHDHKKAVVNQRELGTDTHSFAAALKHVLRQDPDVILVGELRDLETIQVALTAAETGHLVLGTLHTQDAPQTVDRVIDVFPPHQQEQIRVMLAGALQGVVCQQLLRTVDGHGRVAACEVMVATPAVRNLIREGKVHQLYSSIQAGKSHGMVAMDQSLATLVQRGRISYQTGAEHCINRADFDRLCGRA